MEKVHPILMPFFDNKQKRWEIFYDAGEVFELSALKEAEDDEAQGYRVASAQSILCQYAREHDDFVALRNGSGKSIQYGFTQKERLKIADTQRRNKRAENQFENASDRSERLLEKYPKRTSELTLSITKRRVILIKKSKGHKAISEAASLGF